MSGTEDQEHLLGEIAVEYGLLTAEQLRLALALQRRTNPRPALGDVLLEERFITRPVLSRLLEAQRRLRGVSGDEALTARSVASRLEGAALADYLRVQREVGAMELHLVAGAPPFVRAHGGLVDLLPRPLAPEDCRALVAPVVSPDDLRTLQRDGSVVFGVEVDRVRYRAALFEHSRGLTAIFRHIPDAPPDLSTLGLPDCVERIAHLHTGLVLVTGPVASGKTTTLAATIQRMNRGRRRHVITIEQPIEHLFTSEHCQISQREVGRDVPSYATALRSALREDPDVIVVSELSSPERIATALTAAETGHLVLGTLHSSSAARTILRVLDAFTGRQRALVQGMLASQLRMVVSQRLLPAADRTRLHVAAEVLVVNPAVSAMIREDRVHQIQQVMQTSREEGMQLMDDALSALVRAGKVSREEALPFAEDPERIARLEEVRA